ncbi:MAG: hypothetical protein JXJ20_00945 [Anaerolineae bacterium]|nr:hypothetical protein [Anaerolineae bacterium]
MSKFDTQEKLRDVVQEGIRRDLYAAIQARTLLVEIGEYATALNESKYGELMGCIQHHCVVRLSLALCNVFQEKKKQRSICEVSRLLKAHQDKIELKNPGYVCEEPALKQYDLKPSDPDGIFQAIITHLKKQSAQVDSIYKKLKAQRDKRLAHSDRSILSDDLEWPTLKEIDEVIQNVMSIQKLLSMAFFNTFEDILYKDAERIGIAFRRLMEQAGIPRNPPQE